MNTELASDSNILSVNSYKKLGPFSKVAAKTIEEKLSDSHLRILDSFGKFQNIIFKPHSAKSQSVYKKVSITLSEDHLHPFTDI